jgi:hypothetical protein
MPEFNSIVKNGLTSVSEGKIFWTDNNLVTCKEHGACLCLNKDRSIWRCPTCNEGAYVTWQLTLTEVFKFMSYSQIKKLMINTFGEKHYKYHTVDEIPFFKLLENSNVVKEEKRPQP